MSEEEAIENLRKQLFNTREASECGLATKGEFKEEIEAIETVLNMLEKKDKEAQQYFETTIIQSQKFDEELEKRDKIIEKIAFSLADYQMHYDYDKCRSPHMIKQKAEEIIKYFEEKVKSEEMEL